MSEVSIVKLSDCFFTYGNRYFSQWFRLATDLRNQEAKSDHRRDNALDLVRFLRENQTGDTARYVKLEKDLEYTTFEKTKFFV